MTADGATLKLDNQKNDGWKGVCVYQEHNGEVYNCPVRAFGRRYRHLRQHEGQARTYLSAYWVDGLRYDVTAEDMSVGLKQVAEALEYPVAKGIPVE